MNDAIIMYVLHSKNSLCKVHPAKNGGLHATTAKAFYSKELMKNVQFNPCGLLTAKLHVYDFDEYVISHMYSYKKHRSL